jgi:peroxiredoxin
MTRDLSSLPLDLPAPVDDGAARHLEGMALPRVLLPSTRGRLVDVASVGRAVIFAYPRTGRPDEPAPPGWDLIPGARGCTPQACAYRDHHAEFKALGYDVYGLSANAPEHQREFAERMRVPFDVLSDARFELADAMRLPTFEHRGTRLLKRLALATEEGMVRKAFYPVFPPDRNAETVLAWLRSAP